MVVRRSAALLVALNLLAGCGPSATSPSSPTITPSLSASASPGQTAEASIDADAGTLTGTVSVGEAVGTVTVGPFEAGVVEGTGPDGSTYRLEIAAASVRNPEVVTLRPLSSISIDGATLLAGVEIEPSGLRLFVPAVLTIVPATGAGATTPTALEYTGSPDAATARIASVTATSSAAGYQLVLTHFSGGIVTSLTPDTEATLFEAFSASHAQPNTPEGRQARAETGLRTVKWAEEHGRMDHDSATQRTADYEREWWEAEGDRVRDDPALNTKIKNGDPADADTISAEVARMIEAAKRVQDAGGDASPTAIEAMGLAAEYGVNLANHLRSDPAFQATLTSGLVSDLPAITDMLGILAGLARQAALLGNDEAAQAMIQTWKDFIETMAMAIGSTCSQAPITPQMAYGLTRQAALLGQEAAVAALQDCLPTPPPCPAARVPGLAIAITAVSLGRTLAATEACVPLYYKWVATIDPPYDDYQPPFPIGGFVCGDPHVASWWTLVGGYQGGGPLAGNLGFEPFDVDTLAQKMADLTELVGGTNIFSRTREPFLGASTYQTDFGAGPYTNLSLRFIEGTPAKVHIITTNPAGDYSFSEVVAEAVPATFEECVKIGYLITT